MIRTVRILQVGDVHLPTAARQQRHMDDKDGQFPFALKHVMSRVPAKQVFRQIYNLIEKGKVDSILFMGDLTDKGSLEAYRGAVQFLANSLQIGKGKEYADLPIGIVSGNHDINRDLAKNVGFDPKFRPLNEALSAENLPPLPVEQCVHLPVGRDNANVNVVLMNSCWGCGSQTLIPSEFREPIAQAIDKAIMDGGDAELTAYYDQQLDTPAFSDDAITQLISLSANEAKEGQLIAVAHHNLLPQASSRIAPYTELVNSGRMRQAMTQLDKPVIYLHGHIHEDPIEIVRTPTGQPLICISAPAADDGFNVIDVKFTRYGIPLACDIIPWRFDQSGTLRPATPISVSLLGSRLRSHGPALGKIFSKILELGQVWWSDLVSQTPPYFQSDNGAQIVEAIELLRADNSIIVENYQLDPKNWIVRANL